MPQPEHWPGLVACAEELLADPSLTRSNAVAILWGETDQLDKNTLAGCRYYGIGLAICELAQVLRDPKVCEETIQSQSNIIANWHKDYCDEYLYEPTSGLHIRQIRNPHVIFGHIDPVAKIAVSRLAPSVTLVTDVLSYAKDSWFDVRGLEDAIPDLSERTAKIFMPERTVISANQFLTASSSITIQALRNLHNKGKQSPPFTDRDNCDPLLSQVVTPEEFRNLDLLQLAGVAASLRLDEFERLQDFLTIDEEGNTTLQRSNIPTNPGPLPGPASKSTASLIHDERLRCPALYVNGMLRMSLHLTREKAIRAQAEIARRHRAYRWQG